MFKTPRLFFEVIRETEPRLDDTNYLDAMKMKNPNDLDTKMLGRARCISEGIWRKNRRPYYKVYPKILSALCRVSLDLPISSINYPVDTLMILLPEGQKEILCGDNEPLLGLMVTLLRSPKDTVFAIMAYRKVTEMPYFSCGHISRFGEDASIEEVLKVPMNDDRKDHAAAIKLTSKWVRLAVALSLLGQDTDLIVPDILSKDEGKELTDAIINRAHNRGKIGWKIGAGIEVCPHVRIPHLFNACVGPGGKQRKLMWRKGSVIHRDKIKSIPTGFEDRTEILGNG